MDFLSDPTMGEVRIGGNEAIIAGALPAVFERLRRLYPGIVIHVTQAAAFAQQYRDLRDRKIDFIFGCIAPSIEEDVDVEILFQERLFVVAGARNKLSRRRKIELAELADGPWTLSPPEQSGRRSRCRCFPSEWCRGPKQRLGDGVNSPAMRFAGQRRFSGDLARLHVAVLRQSSATQGAARNVTGSALASRHHGLEKPHAQSRGAAFHRVHPRGSKAASE